MEPEGRILNHFEKISDAFDGIYEGEQGSLLHKLVDILFRSVILQKRMEIILNLAGDVRNKEILDIGCGSGRYAIALSLQSPQRILGIDISPSMIALAQEKAKASGCEKICKFEILDFLNKNFQDKFDIIIAAGVFDYTAQPQLFLSKIYDAIEEKAILSFPIKWTLMTPLRKAWLFKKGCPNFYYTKRGIKRLLNLSNLKTVLIYKIGTFFVPGNYIVVCERRRQ